MATIRCLGCGVTFDAYSPPCRPRKYCSVACGRYSQVGAKQSDEHIGKRKRFGADHPLWVGDAVSEKGGRTRALRAYPSPLACERCGRKNHRLDRHHKDGNTANNARDNIASICRKCHMTADGRINRMREVRYGHSLPR